MTQSKSKVTWVRLGCLAGLVGVGGAIAGSNARAGDLCFGNHHFCSTTRIHTHGAIFPGVVGSAPASTVLGVVPAASSYVGVAPAASYLGVMSPSASPLLGVSAASSPVTMAPAASYVLMAPSTSSSLGVVPASASATPIMLPAAAAGLTAASPVAASPAAYQAAASMSHAASAIEAQAAQARFPALANAARLRNIDGGKFVVFLRNLLKGTFRELGEANTPAMRAHLRTLVLAILRDSMGVSPGVGLIATELEHLLDELFDNGDATGPTTGTFDGQTFLIKVTIDGRKVGVTTVNAAEVPAVAPKKGGNPGGPSMGSNGLSNMAPVILPAAGGEPPAAAAAATLGVEPAGTDDVAAQRHAELKAMLESINKSLRTIADKP